MPCHQWRGTACAYSEVEEKALLAELSAVPGGPRTRGGCKASAQGRFQDWSCQSLCSEGASQRDCKCLQLLASDSKASQPWCKESGWEPSAQARLP